MATNHQGGCRLAQQLRDVRISAKVRGVTGWAFMENNDVGLARQNLAKDIQIGFQIAPEQSACLPHDAANTADSQPSISTTWPSSKVVPAIGDVRRS